MAKDKKVGPRVKSGGEPATPIMGSPQHVADKMASKTRVSKGPGLPRKNDPPHKAESRMGLKIGTRVTGKGISGK